MADIVHGTYEVVACENEDCDKTFSPGYRCGPKKRFCSPECRNVAYNRKFMQGVTSDLKMPSPTRGAVSEMKTACDLLERGYEVFRALSSACSCDLIALSPDGVTLRIEVRTAWRNAATGRVYFPRNGITVRGRGEDSLDHYAAVLPGGVTYEPPLAPMGGTPGATPSPVTMTPDLSTSTSAPPSGTASPVPAQTQQQPRGEAS